MPLGTITLLVRLGLLEERLLLLPLRQLRQRLLRRLRPWLQLLPPLLWQPRSGRSRQPALLHLLEALQSNLRMPSVFSLLLELTLCLHEIKQLLFSLFLPETFKIGSRDGSRTHGG